MAVPPKPTAKKGKPDEKNTLKTLLTWGFVVCGIAAIVLMVATNPKQKRLNCSNSSSAGSSLLGFGTCTEE